MSRFEDLLKLCFSIKQRVGIDPLRQSISKPWPLLEATLTAADTLRFLRRWLGSYQLQIQRRASTQPMSTKLLPSAPNTQQQLNSMRVASFGPLRQRLLKFASLTEKLLLARTSHSTVTIFFASNVHIGSQMCTSTSTLHAENF